VKKLKRSIFDDVLTDFIPKFGTPGYETSYSYTDPDFGSVSAAMLKREEFPFTLRRASE
jgi:hypothetical protein